MALLLKRWKSPEGKARYSGDVKCNFVSSTKIRKCTMQGQHPSKLAQSHCHHPMPPAKQKQTTGYQTRKRSPPEYKLKKTHFYAELCKNTKVNPPFLMRPQSQNDSLTSGIILLK